MLCDIKGRLISLTTATCKMCLLQDVSNFLYTLSSTTRRIFTGLSWDFSCEEKMGSGTTDSIRPVSLRGARKSESVSDAAMQDICLGFLPV